MDFPQLTMTLPDGREESTMKRTTLVRRLAVAAGRWATNVLESCIWTPAGTKTCRQERSVELYVCMKQVIGPRVYCSQ